VIISSGPLLYRVPGILPPIMTTASDLQERLVELETRVAFQEHVLQEMGDVVARQQVEIERLTRLLKEVQDRLRGISAPVAEGADETPPPHY
jgi:SlyX protein